ncbi:MAG: molybdopterin-dependent oxidoreductase [Anaerolineaceae bacterium]|nr:molybdopterin-dependent oxidoreductase [Anaerolineaceae bacterium]
MSANPNWPRRGQRPGSGAAESFWGRLSDRLDDWLAIEADGSVTAFSGKVELGTGTRTALAQIVAEELDVPFERVQMVMGDTARTPDEGYTAGSMTISSSGGALRKAAAEARQALLELASERLDAAPDELSVQNGVIFVTQRPERRTSYAELMGGRKFNRQVSGSAPLKNPQNYSIVGRSVARVDFPAKFTGQRSFVQDVEVPGMLHARLVRPPNLKRRLVSLDESSVADVPGLVKVVHEGNFIGVVTEREEQAVLAAKKLKVTWQEAPAFPAMADLFNSLRAQPSQDKVLVESGDLAAALQQSARRLDATYYQPYHAHASIGPSCAVADVTAEMVTVWSSTSGPHPLRNTLAQLLDLPIEKVHLIHVEGAGGYGQNGSDDVAADAVLLSQAVGRPVRVQWTREDEFIWEPKGPAMIFELHGGLDAQGNISAWDYHVWSPSHVARPRFGNQFVASQLISGESAPPLPFSFGAERNAPTNYALPVQRVTVHSLSDSPLRSSAFRSLGGAENTFANESFMDELAAAAGVDALEFRLRYLPEARLREVLQAAADKAGWQAHPSHLQTNEKDGVVEGRGVAFARYENDQAIVACIALVQVDTKSGAMRVLRIVVAHDCGLIINPDGLKNQIEGNVIQSLSRTLKEEVKFDETRQISVDWESYPILKFSEVPEIEIVLINRPEEPAVGAGEPSTVTTAAAVANAIYDATGIRLRQIPFTPERFKDRLA